MTITRTTTDPSIVIVGGGLAALRAAERLAERNLTGTVTVLGAERHGPYNRTPLSKQLLTGQWRERDLAFTTFGDLDVTWRTNTRVRGIDPGKRLLKLAGHETIAYDGLIIATGMEARHLPGAPTHRPDIWTLRTLDDLNGFQRALVGAKRVAVIGGGFIGCEVASSLRARSIDVTVIDGTNVLLERIVGPAIGRAITNVHIKAGVDLRLGTCVESWDTSGPRVGLGLADGTTVEADAVLVCIGTVPGTTWLNGHGLDLSDGILCDPTCHTVGLADTVAAGDVARWPNHRFDIKPRRVEHWINAVEMARHAVDSLLAGPKAAQPFEPVPRFWSEQHGVKIQAVGILPLGPEITIVDGLLEPNRLVATYTDNGRLMGALSLNDRAVRARRNNRRPGHRWPPPHVSPQRCRTNRIVTGPP
jgi:NADPH-dependent 2,4-dienoyl-CoA reductase/sulfur reductase-like enzyme